MKSPIYRKRYVRHQSGRCHVCTEQLVAITNKYGMTVYRNLGSIGWNTLIDTKEFESAKRKLFLLELQNTNDLPAPIEIDDYLYSGSKWTES